MQEVLLSQLIQCAEAPGAKQDVLKKHFLSGVVSGILVSYIKNVLEFCFSKLI